MRHYSIHPSFLTWQYLSQDDAQKIDEWLMSETGGGYKLEQLMELAGLAASCAIHNFYPDLKNILVIAGKLRNDTSKFAPMIL